MYYLKKLTAVMLYLSLSACATKDYVTHYGIFTAENSLGEQRQFRVHWQKVRYEGWTENTFRAFPVILEAQCSKRKMYLYDATFGEGRRCKGNDENGIQYCGDSQIDMDRRGLEIEDHTECLSITDRYGSKDILSLRGDVLIKVSCRPKVTQKNSLDQKTNLDYLLTSEVPYTVSTKYILGGNGNVDLIIPELSTHSSICDPDG